MLLYVQKVYQDGHQYRENLSFYDFLFIVYAVRPCLLNIFGEIYRGIILYTLYS